jgi:hypothetical protein
VLGQNRLGREQKGDKERAREMEKILAEKGNFHAETGKLTRADSDFVNFWAILLYWLMTDLFSIKMFPSTLVVYFCGWLSMPGGSQ